MDNLRVSNGVSSRVIEGNILPIPGMVLPYAGSTEPTGWKFCNGQDLLIADYPLLYVALGSGSIFTGAASGYFRLPNLVGKFLRGTTNTSLVGTNTGSANHDHNYVYNATNSAGATLAGHNHSVTTSIPGYDFYHAHSVDLAGFSYSGSNTVGQGNGNSQANILSNTHGHWTGWFYIGSSNAATISHTHGNSAASGASTATNHVHQHTVGASNTGTISSGSSLPSKIINLNYIVKAG